MFIYSLDKSSKKYNCPTCGQKRLVRYFDNVNNQYCTEMFGRCDRETSCGYHKVPTSEKSLIMQPIKPTIVRTDYIDESLVQRSLKKYDQNNLFLYLQNYFPPELVLEKFKEYRVGTSAHWFGASIFYQIDQFGKIRTGKIILIDRNSGKRVKEPFPHIHWVHKKLPQKSFNLSQCLFGLHLIKDFSKSNKTQRIAIVESEKTAMIMSLFMPQFIWLATGGKQNLSAKMLQPLLRFPITIFPDNGEFEDWEAKANRLNSFGYNIQCSSLLEKSNFQIGADLADMYIEMAAKESTNKVEIKYSAAEKTVFRMAKKNPVLLDFIKIFDLIDDKGNGIRIE